MNELIFIRHAATDLAGTFCGHTDPPINEQGESQIATFLQHFTVAPTDILISSDLRRAHTTAVRLAATDASRIITTPALREINFGEWEALRWAEIEARDPLFARQWTEQFPTLTAPKAEPYQAFSTRVLDCIAHIERTHPARRILIITHAGVMREILQHRCHLTPAQAWQDTREYCSTFTLPRPA